MPFPETIVYDDDLNAAAENMRNQLEAKADAIVAAVINSPDMAMDDKVTIITSVYNMQRHQTTVCNQLLTIFRPESEEPEP